MKTHHSKLQISIKYTLLPIGKYWVLSDFVLVVLMTMSLTKSVTRLMDNITVLMETSFPRDLATE
jgi:hypothetical protein